MSHAKITSIDGRVLAALTLASCLPMDDLSRYSRGTDAVTDAGHNFTSATPGLVLSAEPAPPSRPAPGRHEPPPAAPDGSEAPEPSADAGSAPPGSVEDCITRVDSDGGADSCYAFSQEPSRWSEALDACRGWGGSLVSLNSAAESEWLAALVDVTIWIGANDRQREGTFAWANGDAFQFELFAEGEPDNTLGIQDCVERRVDASWNDRACSVLNPFVCERSL